MKPAIRIRPLLSLLTLAVPAWLGAASGGPDLDGYTWADSDQPGITTSYPNYTPTDYTLLGFVGDEAVLQVDLPLTIFPLGFPYRGANYPRFWLSTNGWLSFEDPALNPHQVPSDLPSTGAPRSQVAFFWDDWTLDPTLPLADGGPNTANDGYTFFVQLEPKTDPGIRANIYVTLYQTGVIKFVYFGQLDGKSSRTSIGIENSAGDRGLAYMASGVPQSGANFRSDYAVQFFPRGRLDCSGATALTCGQGATAYSNATGANNVSSYNCSGGTYLGFEKAFSLNLTRSSNLTITLNNTDGRNRAAFLLGACSEYTGCLVGGSTVLSPRFVPSGPYLIVVDGVTATDNGNFTLAVDCQDAATGLPCNTTLTAQSMSGASALNNWDCTFGQTGPEKVYEVAVTGPATLRATLSNPSTLDLSVLISDALGFDVNNPKCYTSDPTQARLWNAATGSYYVSVESTSATTSASFDISVECSSKLVCPSPPRPITLSPPTPVTGDTTGKPNNVDQYYCTRSAYGTAGETATYNGPEDVYEFTITSPSTISFLFDTPNPNLRLLILKDCYEGSCVMEGGCGEYLEPGTYRLVVDGLNGAAGSYTFTPFVVPALPYKYWYQCPEGNNQNPSDIRLKTWNFNSGNFCGTGCDFSLFAVVECGTEFHIPMFDDETGHMQIFDVLQQRYVDLTAVNNAPVGSGCEFSDSGPYVEWEDNTCSAIPCPGANCGGGADCRTDGRVMDVSFRGQPNVCGVYKIDFINWGGFVWQAFANCTGQNTEQFYLYRDLCSALANYHPLPEVGIANVTVDNLQCASNIASGTITLENVGCLPAANMEIVIESATPPANPQVIPVSLLKGQQATLPWTYNLGPTRPANLLFKVDPNLRILECSENLGSTVQCGTNTSLQRQVSAIACPAVCQTAADAGPDRTICEQESLLVDGSASVLTCVTGTPQYRWEDLAGNPVPGCDWSTTAACTIPPVLLPAGPQIFTLKTRCLGDSPPCESQAQLLVDVIPNVVPPRIGNVLRAYRDDETVRFSWAAILGSPISGYKMFKDGVKWLPPASRQLLGGAAMPATWTTTSDEGGVILNPRPIAYYQIVGVSCFGDLEGPY